MPDTSYILQYLQDLNQNNDRDWFNANKERFQKAQDQFQDIVTEVIGVVRTFDPGIGDVQVKDCLFRIYRDTRFSKDKLPYKTHFGAYIANGGRKSVMAGYYIHLDAVNSMAAGGIWHPEPEVLKAIRQEIYFNLGEFDAILESPGLKKYFGGMDTEEKLSRPPKGYSDDFQGIEHIKHKNFTLARMLSEKEVSGGKLINHLTDSFRAMAEFNAFLNRAIGMMKAQ